jgi:Na+/proline symporter
MDVQTLTFIFVGTTFALYIGIAIWARAGNTDDFYVAGGGVPPLANGMATAADWMSAASFISMAGIISFVGRDGAVYLMGWTGGYVLLALLLAPYLRKFGKQSPILLAIAIILILPVWSPLCVFYLFPSPMWQVKCAGWGLFFRVFSKLKSLQVFSSV